MNCKKPCLKRHEFDWLCFTRWGIFTKKNLLRNFGAVPVLVITSCVVSSIPFVVYDRTFRTTIDVRLGGCMPRWEIPNTPTWFDLRKPRSLKWLQTRVWKPAIHLDNRYRQMRGQPMLDANGNETDEIGEDEEGCTLTEEM